MRFKSAVSALGIAMALVIGLDYLAFAATGGSFLLGKSNSASTTTSLSRTTNGPTLVLNSKAGQPPLKVNRKVKAVNLNADLLDGREGASMLNRPLRWSTPISKPSASNIEVTLPSVPVGTYQLTASAFIYADTAGGVACYMEVPSTGRTLYEWFPDSGDFIMPSQVGVVQVPTTQDLKYRCYNNSGTTSTWTSLGSQPLEITLTRIDAFQSGTPATARIGAGSSARTAR